MTKQALLAALNSPTIPHDAEVTLVLTGGSECLNFAAVNDARVWSSVAGQTDLDAIALVP
jgi:hypothetical protein